ncbi:MAG TPA: TraR/DksA C4-type zinc finger protein [Conexibacter sp.]|jgi:DnaK suppressor protein
MNVAEARELLARERARIEQELVELGADDGESEELSHVDQHFDDATDLFEREIDGGVADQLQEDLDAIARAEQRLADGKYGLSVESGAPIPDARLRVVPWAERTVDEQAAHDRRA